MFHRPHRNSLISLVRDYLKCFFKEAVSNRQNGRGSVGGKNFRYEIFVIFCGNVFKVFKELKNERGKKYKILSSSIYLFLTEINVYVDQKK